MKKNVVIIGAGLVGSLLAIYLIKRGFNVSIFERRPDLRKNRISAGKSINLALSDRGWRGLKAVGIDEEVRKVAIPMKGRYLHPVTGSLGFQPYGKDNQAIYSVSRGGLNCLLMDLTEKFGAQIFFHERCTHVDLKADKALFQNEISGTSREVNADIFFGADGAFSAARLSMQLSNDRFQYQQFYLEHGYKELTIPPAKDGNFAMAHDGLHIWPRGKFMLIALPNLDKSFTCTLFFPFEGKDSFAGLDTPEKMKNFFKTTFPDACDLMPELESDYFNNPTSSLVTVKCSPWVFEDKLALIGDAAHAIVPFFGQGMNCGFEDCFVLDSLFDKFGNDIPEIFRTYETLRKPDADAIAELAIGNFIEMRDKTADARFLLQKKIEARFSERHPELWIPLYSMVTFQPDIRYSDALKRGKIQEGIMQEVMQIPDIEKKWDSDIVEKKMLEILSGLR